MGVKDGLLAIANEVLGDVQKEAEAMVLAAENEAKETLKATKERADENYLTLMSQATAEAESERRKVASVTELEMRNRLLQTKENLVDAAFEKALIKLKIFVETQEYRDYLIWLVEEVAKKIGQKKLTVQVNTKDKAWLTQDILNSLSEKLHCELRMSDQMKDYIGGCKIQTTDDKIAYDSTIDYRLQELKPALRVKIAKILFEKEI